jgi:hypothetical protein
MKYFSILLLSLIYFSPDIYSKVINIPSDVNSIQAGINLANAGDTIFVHPGIYNENIDFLGKEITVCSFYLIMKDESHISNTIINGKEQCSVVTFENEETRNACLIGFTIQNGKDDWSGGGIYCENASPTLKHLIIKDNQAGGGGGLFCIDFSNPYLQNVLITNNKAEKGGGIMSMSNSQPVLVNVTIADNIADQGDGLICCGSQPFIINSLISDSICCAGWSEKSTYVVSHSNIRQGYEGLIQHENIELNWLDGNIQGDPGFVNINNQDYKLNDCSNSIDKGVTEFVWMGETIFALSENEYYGQLPDLGAMEFQNVSDE